MTDRELMQMALDSIVYYAGGEDNLYGEDKDLLKALRERLAEPEAEPVCDKIPQECWSIRCQLGRICKNTAPPKREWVGLTSDEVVKELGQIREQVTGDVFGGFYRAIEAKLRSKNT